jgi:uncharacterized protein (UPF0261 family)
LGKEIAHKASAARGPTLVLVPLGGFSKWDREGGPFWEPEANRTLGQSLRNWMSPHVELRERQGHLADQGFLAEGVSWLVSQASARR